MFGGSVTNLFLGLLVALLPLFNRFAQYDFSRTSKDNLFAISLIAIMFFLPRKKRHLGIITKLVAFFLFLLIAFNHWYVLSINVMIQTFYITSGLFFILSYAESADEDKGFIIKGVIFGSIIQSVMAVIDSFGIPSYAVAVTTFMPQVKTSYTGGNIIGSLGNPNILACYVALSIPFFFAYKWSKWLLWLPLTAIYLADSDISTFALLGGVGYYINHRYKIIKTSWLYILSTIPMILLYFLGMGGMDSGRLPTWQKNIDRLIESPFLGYGPGWFADAKLTPKSTSDVTYVLIQEHNEFLACVNTFGLVGMALIAFVFYRCRTPPLMWGSVLYIGFLNAYGHFSLHVSTTAIILLIAGAVCLSGGKDVINLDGSRTPN